ncbi:MAG: hypothetical protein CVU59_10545 [Deltaproteobacteria bacterium HGW-Deltaproteobacteria-17]|nr:MAG: hypothetical protein CVU59_10545 [Deltaproteobacteria bacterium HGW-Deltaproteobacteria-17]
MPIELQTSEGRSLEITARCLYTKDREPVGRLLVLRDRTEERKSEHLLRQAQKLETVGSLAAGVAHEVNNPLAFVRANLRQIERLGGLVAKRAERIAESERDADDLAEFPQLIAEFCRAVREAAGGALRLAEMEFNRAGVRTSVELYPAVIRSHARLTYEQVAAVLVGDPVDVPYRERILMTAEWAAVQHKRRLERGSLELELPEAKVLLDEDDPLRVRNIVKSIPNPQTKQAYNVVEEAMLAANEAVGEYLAAAGQPVPWRVHEAPDPEKIEAFFRFAAFLGIPVPKEMGPRWFSEVFESISAHPAKGAISYMLLRSLKQAQYRVDNVGHFALASPTYLHFTSPIRRYPDLMVHRALKEVWKKRGLPTGEASLRACPQKEKTGELSTKCSQNERRCIDVERKVTDIYRAWYMRPRIGDVFEGHIHSITRFGLFVGIDDPFVEGLIRLDWLSEEFFEYDEGLGIVRGTQSKRMLLPGDPVRVILAKADVIQGQLSFEVEGSVFSMIPHRHQPRTTEQPPVRGKTDARGGHGAKPAGHGARPGGHKKPERPDPKSRPKKSRR